MRGEPVLPYDLVTADVIAAAAATVSDDPDPSAPEKRATPRVPCSIRVHVRTDAGSRSAAAEDLSAGGMRLAYDAPCELGEVLSLRFSLDRVLEGAAPPGGEIACVGLVRSITRQGSRSKVGLEFHKLAPEDRRGIAAWVRGCTTAPGEQARAHWMHLGEVGVGERVGEDERKEPVVRWRLGLSALWDEVTAGLKERPTFFVPVADVDGLEEGARIQLEVVPPNTHAVLRLHSEILWVQDDSRGRGLGLRHSGLTRDDRFLLGALSAWYDEERRRYR